MKSTSAIYKTILLSSTMIFGLVLVPAASAQTESIAMLPDAPDVIAHQWIAPALTASDAAAFTGTGSIFPSNDPTLPASPYEKYILPDQQAPHLTSGDKVVLGLRDAVSPFSLVGSLASAGWSHLTNGSPNYGVNSTAFAQRFGAAVARDTSEGLFTDCIFAPLYHQDPRYYEMGDGHNVIKRFLYAATRTIITRTDSGRTAPNIALLSGYAGAAALTNVYYPQLNRGPQQTMLTFGGELAGAVVGNEVSEFLGDVLHIMHLKRSK